MHQIVAVACIGVRIAQRMQHTNATESRETVGGSSCSGELSSGGGSTKMITDCRRDANRKVVVKRR